MPTDQTAEQDGTAPTAVVVAGFDSALKYGARIADALEARGARVTLAVPTDSHAGTPSPEQIRAVTGRDVATARWRELVALARQADVAFPVFEGDRIQQFFVELQATASARRLPVLGAGYVGMVLYDHVNGYLFRSLADVLAVNSRSDRSAFAAAADALGLPTDNLLLAGLPLLPARPSPARAGELRRVLFADQPTVPQRPEERVRLYRRLVDYAVAHPDREVLIRPRHRADERTFHRMDFSPEAFAAGIDVPVNLRIDHTPIVELLPAVDLVLSVSSTAVVEALAAGCRVAFVADFFGERYLNQGFVGSGLLRTMDRIIADDLGNPDPAWLDDLFPSTKAPADVVASRLLSLIDAADRPHERMLAHPFQRERLGGDPADDALLASLRAQRLLPEPASAAERAIRRATWFLPDRLQDRLVRRARGYAERA